MPSTVIRRFDYRPETRELEILFVTGRRYLYSEVPEELVRRFRAAFSKGIFFNRFIRDHFHYRELHDAAYVIISYSCHGWVMRPSPDGLKR